MTAHTALSSPRHGFVGAGRPDGRRLGLVPRLRSTHGITVRQAVSLLERRRRFAFLRALGTGLLLACLVAGLLLVLSPARTHPVAVASHQLAAGHRITATDLHLVYADDSSPLAGTSRRTDSLLGRYTLVGLAAGAAIPQSATAADSPVPQGFTVLSVPLASSPTGLRYGQKVNLTAASQVFPAILKSTPSTGPAENGLGSPSGVNGRTETRVLVALDVKQARALLALVDKEPLFIVAASD